MTEVTPTVIPTETRPPTKACKIDLSEYIRAYGRTPGGRGNYWWTFKDATGAVIEQRVFRDPYGNPLLTATEAKRKARLYGRSIGAVTAVLGS